MTGPARRAGAALAAALILAGCTIGSDGSQSGDTGGPGDPGDTGDTASGGTSATSGGEQTTEAGPSPYLPVPDGVVLTDPGSELGVGEQATVAWRLEKKPDKGKVAVLRMKVRSLVRADIKVLKDWELSKAERSSSLYYVTVTAANLGHQDLGGRRVPLYALDGDDALVESSVFKTTFRPCPSPALPDRFGTGAKTTVCLLYLVPAHGLLKAATFRPTAAFNPISWVGKVTRAKTPLKPRAAG